MRIATSILGTVTIALIVGPADSSARGGGIAGGRAAPMARPAVAPALPATAPARPALGPAHLHARAPFAHARHRRFGRDGFAGGWWSYPSYSDYYSAYPSYVPYDQPAYPDQATSYPSGAYLPYAYAEPPARERVIYVVPRYPGCDTQTYLVRSEQGGERSINVVRC
jgi:hypothetical protein